MGDADIDSVILDCGHLVSCNLCGNKLNECPICRQHVAEVLQVVLVSELDLDRLTSKEIKQVLALCGVSFKDRVAARRAQEEREILKEKHKCQVCILYIITHIIIMQGVHEQPHGLCVPSVWPYDDLHPLWPQTC